MNNHVQPLRLSGRDACQDPWRQLHESEFHP